MSLMRALRGVATGYLGARVDQMNALAKAKAEEKKWIKEYKTWMRWNRRKKALDAKGAELDELYKASGEAEREMFTDSPDGGSSDLRCSGRDSLTSLLCKIEAIRM